MPLSRFSCTCNDCPLCRARPNLLPHSSALRHTVQSLQHRVQQHNPLRGGQLQQLTSNPQVRLGGAAVLGVIGLAAIAGAVVYATRNPRIPPGVQPVENFDLDRYLGKWYELARIDHRFEKGLQRTQAEYSRLPNSQIQVVNRGFDPKRGEWKVAHGKAKPTIAPDVAALKVAFFGPFYSGYNVVALDEDYQWAMVVGDKLDYFWILSRQLALPEGVQEQLMTQAQDLGVDTQKVLWVHQDGVNPTGVYKKK